MTQTKIEWCDRVWNPVTGCTKVSPGCQNYYAERMARRLAGRHGYPKEDPFRVTLHPGRLEKPLRWRKPSRVFVCSMGDLFHSHVPDSFIWDVFSKMLEVGQHIYLLLTKRPERMAKFFRNIEDWNPSETPHIWLGVTAENQEQADARIPVLLQIPAAVRFVLVEPMLGPVDLHKYLALEWSEIVENWISIGPGARPFIDWVICGGESGPGARPMHPDWARSLQEQCRVAGVPYFFKQHGEWVPNDQRWRDHSHLDFEQKHVYLDDVAMCRVGKKKAGRLLDGAEWNEMPGVG